MLRILSILLFASSCGGPGGGHGPTHSVPAQPISRATDRVPSGPSESSQAPVATPDSATLHAPRNGQARVPAERPSSTESDMRARAVVFQSISLMRDMSRIMMVNRDDCDAMAAALQRWGSRHRVRLEQHLQRAMTIPAAKRAQLMQGMMRDDTQIATGMDALQSCLHHPPVVEAVQRLQMAPTQAE